MGTLYCVFPLSEEWAAWLDREGIPHPAVSERFRNPTPAEIEAVLQGLPDYTAEIRRDREQGTWYGHVSWAENPSQGPWTEIVVREYCSDDSPHNFYFTKGWLEIILLVVERLSHTCGPLAIADDSCAVPYLIQPGMELPKMIAEYNAR